MQMHHQQSFFNQQANLVCCVKQKCPFDAQTLSSLLRPAILAAPHLETLVNSGCLQPCNHLFVILTNMNPMFFIVFW